MDERICHGLRFQDSQSAVEGRKEEGGRREVNVGKFVEHGTTIWL